MRLPVRFALTLFCFIVAVGCGGDDDGSDRADAAAGADATSAPDGGGEPDGGPGAWLAGWGYRRPIVIAVPPSTPPMENQQLNFDLFVQQAMDDGKMRLDAGDIRVTGPDGTTVLPYWIERETTSGILASERPLRIWFKSPSVLPDAQYVYVYYGNPDATDESSGTDTFEFFDDFDGTELDPMWTVATLDQGAVTVSGGQLHLTATVGSTGNAASIAGPELFTSIILGAQLTRVTAPNRSHADILLRSTDAGFYFGSGTWLQTSWGLGAPADGAGAGGVISDIDGFNGPAADSVNGSSSLAVLYVSGFSTYQAEFTYNHYDLGQVSSQAEGWAVASALHPALSANTYGAGFPAFDYRFDWIFAAKRPTVSPLVVAVAPEEQP